MADSALIKQIKSFLIKMIELGGSDLHIRTGGLIRARIKGDITPLGNSIVTPEIGEAICKEILGNRYEEFVKNKEIDFTFKLDDNYRFRGNAFYQMDGPSIVLRVIPVKILSFDELQLPQAIKKIVDVERGIVMVTGVTGSGKSTTLAAIINEINKTKKKHIITIEDPVEFVHKEQQCIINQRSIGQDSLSFSNALKGALREDPDVILIGEMRDIETVEIALHAAETGHLVFSTLHTLDTKETINRVIGMFPPEEQNRVRLTLGSIVEGVLSQRLVKTIDGKRAAAIEILLGTPRIQQLIMDNRDNEIIDSIEEGKEIYGTQSFDQALIDLVMKGRITDEVAIENATSPDDLLLKLKQAKMQAVSDKGESVIEEDDILELKMD